MMNQTHHPPHYQDLQGRTKKIQPTWQCQSLSKQDNYVNICCVCVGYQNYLILREENEFFFKLWFFFYDSGNSLKWHETYFGDNETCLFLRRRDSDCEYSC